MTSSSCNFFLIVTFTVVNTWWRDIREALGGETFVRPKMHACIQKKFPYLPEEGKFDPNRLMPYSSILRGGTRENYKPLSQPSTLPYQIAK